MPGLHERIGQVLQRVLLCIGLLAALLLPLSRFGLVNDPVAARMWIRRMGGCGRSRVAIWTQRLRFDGPLMSHHPLVSGQIWPSGMSCWPSRWTRRSRAQNPLVLLRSQLPPRHIRMGRMWLIPRMRQTHLDMPVQWANAQEFVDPGGRYPADVALLRCGLGRVSLSRGLLSRPMPDYPFLVLVLEEMRYSHGIRGNHRESRVRHSMG